MQHRTIQWLQFIGKKNQNILHVHAVTLVQLLW